MVVQQQRLPSRIVRIVMTATLLTAAFIYDTDVVRKIYDKNVVSSNEMKTVQKEKNGLTSSKCTCVFIAISWQSLSRHAIEQRRASQ